MADRGGPDWFKIVAITLGVLAALAIGGGVFLMAAAFLWVGM